MRVSVVDASALAALLFGEPAAGEAARLLAGRHLAAPTLLRYEIGSICLKKLRRYPEQREAILSAQALYDRMSIDEVLVDVADAVLLAEVSRLTLYDAAYLWLARELEADLVTLDAELRRAADARPTGRAPGATSSRRRRAP